MEKNASAYRTIGEAAEELDLPQHVLRFWETRFSQISPMKRSGGRRYYRPEDLELLGAIRHLLYGEGYTIKGVQRILKQQGTRAVVELVQQLKNGGATSVAAVTAATPVSNADASPADTRGDRGETAAAGETYQDDAPVMRTGGVSGGKSAVLSGETVDRLSAVLSELEACARTLETARSS
ncbi:MAG: MerR family transcriptional regulator [Hyphomicrobiales bacterium]|nr:MerR family transcriptional regulator [Hyphomicrobiales bacterium]